MTADDPARVEHDGLTVGREYAVERDDGWHIATWDGTCFNVTSDWQSGDRWLPGQVVRHMLLPHGT